MSPDDEAHAIQARASPVGATPPEVVGVDRIATLATEFQHEAATTRRHLVRLPEERFEWRPHPKSSTAGDLASHLVDCVRWIGPIFTADELDMDPAAYTPFRAASSRELIAAFDNEVARGVAAIAHSDDPDAAKPWRLAFNGKVRFERPREAVLRDMALSHLIHHRGQLSVYLRLMDVAVPGSYGPTADER